jgi:endonuclease YncB( thermonuclease family)
MGNLPFFNPHLNKTSKETPLFSLGGMKFTAKVVYVYDGDTIHCVFKFNGTYQRFKIRMMGYDSPEIKPKQGDRTHESLADEKAAAIKARDALSGKILHHIVDLQIANVDDKYGRLLATVFTRSCCVGSININEWMIEQGHGYEYHGKTKKDFDCPAVASQLAEED